MVLINKIRVTVNFNLTERITEIFVTLTNVWWMQLDVIGIDEAQFFEDLYEFCCKAADEDGKTVIVAGLDGDYLRYCSEILI